jgi:hypothetical protein
MKSRFALLCAAVLGTSVLFGCQPQMQTKYDVAKGLQSEGKPVQAADKYKEFIGDAANKDSTLLPFAQYNIALCYKADYNKPAAMAAYAEVIAKWPTSQPAEWAKIEMAELEKVDLKRPTTTTTTAKPTTTTVKATTTTAKATTTTAKVTTTTAAKTTVTTVPAKSTTTLPPVKK